MSKTKWTHGQGSNDNAGSYKLCDLCGEYVYWRDEADHMDHAHDIRADEDELFDPLDVRIARLRALIAHTQDRRMLYELRKGLILMQSQLVREYATA